MNAQMARCLQRLARARLYLPQPQIGERVGTRTAEDAKSYDRATELEVAGATVLDLKPTEWRDLALAA